MKRITFSPSLADGLEQSRRMVLPGNSCEGEGGNCHSYLSSKLSIIPESVEAMSKPLWRSSTCCWAFSGESKIMCALLMRPQHFGGSVRIFFSWKLFLASLTWLNHYISDFCVPCSMFSSLRFALYRHLSFSLSSFVRLFISRFIHCHSFPIWSTNWSISNYMQQ